MRALNGVVDTRLGQLIGGRRQRGPLERTGEVAGAVARGLLAGALGTAAMTASSTIEMKARGRSGSSAPAEAARAGLGVEPSSEEGQARLANVVHWGYGTGWGAVRGVLDAAGLDGPRAAAAHFALVWGGEQVMLPALNVSPPAWKWGAKEIAIDMLHHGIYAAATSAGYRALER